MSLAHQQQPHPAIQFIAPNHIGDIAKRHPALAFERCERWLAAPTKERNWVVRHAVRHPAKQGVAAALELRRRAK